MTNTIDDDHHRESYFFLKPSITLNHRRLIPYDIFKLNVGDNIIIVIPIDRPKDTAAVKSVRGGLKRRILKVICDSRRDVLANLNRQQHNFTLDQFLLQYHEVQREGYCYVEFPAVITNYVNRQVYLDGGFNESYIDRLWEQGASVGCTLCNYDSRIMLDIKFSEFAAIELYNQRESNDHYNPKIVFPEKLKQTTGLAEPLREFLHLVHGDVASTYEVLFKLYQSESSIIQGMFEKCICHYKRKNKS